MFEEEIHSGHRAKMRKKLLNFGLASFAPHEIVEMLLYYTTPRKNTNEKAHRLIEQFGSLGALLSAPIEALRESDLSDNTIALFKIITECQPFYYASIAESIIYDNPEKLKRLFLYQFPGKKEEQLLLACFSQKLTLIDNHVYSIAVGGNHSTELNMRNMMEIIIRTGTNLIAIAHNHPDGDAEPSKSDIYSTRHMSRAFKAIDATLLDHIIVGANDAFSLREHNIIGAFD
jgi:DNA repair protein RadC